MQLYLFSVAIINMNTSVVTIILLVHAWPSSFYFVLISSTRLPYSALASLSILARMGVECVHIFLLLSLANQQSIALLSSFSLFCLPHYHSLQESTIVHIFQFRINLGYFRCFITCIISCVFSHSSYLNELERVVEPRKLWFRTIIRSLMKKNTMNRLMNRKASGSCNR